VEWWEAPAALVAREVAATVEALRVVRRVATGMALRVAMWAAA